MRWPARAVAALLVLALAAPVAAEPLILLPGQSVTSEGVFITAEDVKTLIELLRDADTAKAVSETLKAAIASKDAEIAKLVVALGEKDKAIRDQEIALIRAEEREKLRAEMDAKDTALVGRLMALLEAERKQRNMERLLSLIRAAHNFRARNRHRPQPELRGRIA